MKILMLGWELPPHNSGGLGVACYQLCKHLAAQGVEIDFVVPYTANHQGTEFMEVLGATSYSAELMQELLGGAYESARLTTYRSEFEDAAELPGSLREQQQRYIGYVRKLTSERHYDLIHAHDWLTYEAAQVAKHQLGVPLIAHVHATEFDRAGGLDGNSLVHEIEYTSFLLADRIIAVSQATKNIIIKHYQIPAEKIEVVHNSIDPSDFQDIPTEPSYAYIAHMKAKGYTVIASVGRLTIQKGLGFLLEAAKLAMDYNPKLLVVIAGNGEQYHGLIEAAAELGIADRVLFTGFVRGAPWRDVFALADIFVMPSVSEPFGLVALEAAGYGNAVVISRQSGVGEVLSHVLRFDFWDTQRLANQIVALSESGPLKAELLEHCRKEFQGLSWHRVAKQCLELYQRHQPEITASGKVAV
ncbi:MAG TPA: glycosyltransferase family 4 protein [Candidatus Saccharimonadales bacterium]|nr:glycosyltransferase family 4 protein [Candidatus Saccharimonadales bacterium]